MSSKIVQAEFWPKDKSQDQQLISSLKCLFAGHNEIVKSHKEMKEFHDFLLLSILETQDALMAVSDRLSRMDSTSFEIIEHPKVTHA